MRLPVIATASCRSTAWSAWTTLLCVLAILSAATAVTASSSAEFIETDEYIHLQKHTASDQNVGESSNRTVLAYITPWNSKGTQMVDGYSDRIDLVSPVWYTILVSHPSDGASAKSKRGGNRADATYRLSGGPPHSQDEAWLRRKLEQDSDRVQIVPRFYLDGWEQKDYADLLSNPSNWARLAKVITEEVDKRGFHGLVFESAATHLLFEPIQTLSASLQALGGNKKRSLTVVLAPLRTPYSLGGGKVDRVQESQNRMIVQSIPQLAQVVDFFSIMTYDMSSAGGRVSGISGKDLPKDSPLRGAKKESLRHPGPNTSPEWIKENLHMIEEAVRSAARAKLVKKQELQEGEEEQETDDDGMEWLKDPSNPFLYSDFAAQEVLDEEQEQEQEQEQVEEEGQQDELALIRGKLLMGMPMYGYRYPLFWIDKSTGQGVPLPPPSNVAQAQELISRTEPSSSRALLPFLRGPGEAVTMDAIVSILTDNDGVIVDGKQGDGEGWFDYAETVTEEHTKGRESHGVKEGDQIYWRLYLPLPSTTRSRLSALDAEPELRAGVSLWELGQASPLLLQDL